MKLASIVLLFFSCLDFISGQTNTDSLWQIWKGQDYPLTERLNALETICEKKYLYTKPDSAFVLAKIGYEFAENKDLKNEMAANLRIMGIASSRLSNYDKAIEYLNSSIEISQDMGTEVVTAQYLQDLGDVYLRKNNYTIAIDNYTQSLQIAKSNNDEKPNSNLKAAIFLGALFVFIVVIFFARKKYTIMLLEQQELERKVEILESKLEKQKESSISQKQKRTLDKVKIEAALGSKIGASSWTILALISENPSISNKEIAEKVSLSVEGVSSSLRRMYTTFDIKSLGNKKITLLMKAFNLSEKQ